MRLSHSRTLIAATSLLSAGSLACGDSGLADCACTEEFRTYTLEVVDGLGQPLNDVVLTRTNLRTGKVLDPGWLGLLQDGHYVVADDGQLDEFSGDGDVLRVVGERNGQSFTVDLTFAVPEPCRCHVERLSGPARVVMN